MVLPVSNQLIRNVAPLDTACPNCGVNAVIVATVHQFVPSSTIMLPMPRGHANGQQQATGKAEGKEGHALCLHCLRRESWVAAEGKWDKRVLYAGMNEDDAPTSSAAP